MSYFKPIVIRFYLIRAMKKLATYLIIAFVTVGCSSKKKIPDVSNIQVELKTIRFEKDFFAIDTINMDKGLQALFINHKGFTQDFLYNILGIVQNPDSVMSNSKQFIATYRSIYSASIKPFQDFTPIENEVKRGLQFVNYYFPKYPLPKKIITFIGPLNSYAGIITPDNSLAVGLQLYLGKNYTVYQSEEVLNMYPSYVSRKFESPYISVNCIKNVIDDIFTLNQPPKKSTQLIEKMIDEGKRLYVLDALLPYTADSLKSGYTQQQIDNSIASEKNIWAFFVENDLLYQTDPTVISPYVNDGPNTAELGDKSPGNIGQFVGYQIVKKWMEKNDKIGLDKLIQKPSKQLFEEAKYRP